jgi:hypothetical protein
MKQLITALGSYFTGDDIADAVLDYGQALAREGHTDLIDIPVAGDGGSTRLRFSIGWLILVHAVDAETDDDDVVEPGTATVLWERAKRLTSPDVAAEPLDRTDFSELGWLDYA